MNRAAHAVASTIAVAAISTAWLGAQHPTPAVPLAPVNAVLDALRSNQVVGLGLGAHNNLQGHAFLLSLIRHREFPGTGTDLVVECGNARYQDTMDRFVAGEDVAFDVLRRTWQDTTQPHSGCDVPIHEELYRTVRSLNASRPAAQHVRIVLGDPPMDWESPTAKEDRDELMTMRVSHPAQLIQRDVLAKGRRALVVYGQMHLQRKQLASNYDMSHPLAHTIVSLLEGAGIKVFTVWGNARADLETLQPTIAGWPRPSVAYVRGTLLGAKDFEFFYGSAISRFAVIDGKPVPVPSDQWRSLAMEEQFDALLYLGPPSTMTTATIPLSLCADAAYLMMRLRRLDAEGPKPEAERLRKYCADNSR